MKLLTLTGAWLLAGVLIVPSAVWAAESWTTDSAQGITEYRIENAQGDEFNISCDVEASVNGGEGTAILVTLGGKDPEPKSQVKILLDSETFTLPVSAASMIATDCQACSAGFKTLWGKLRAAHVMRVQYAGGASAAFSLDGAAAVLPAQPCKTAFAP